MLSRYGLGILALIVVVIGGKPHPWACETVERMDPGHGVLVVCNTSDIPERMQLWLLRAITSEAACALH